MNSNLYQASDLAHYHVQMLYLPANLQTGMVFLLDYTMFYPGHSLSYSPFQRSPSFICHSCQMFYFPFPASSDFNFRLTSRQVTLYL